MEVTFINVGYGDAFLIQKEQFTALLDGGSALKTEFHGFPYRIRAADFLRETQVEAIDLMMISHIHEDHVCGLEEILYGIPVRKLLIPYERSLFEEEREFVPDADAPRSVHLFSKALSALTRMVAYARNKGIPVELLEPGKNIEAPVRMEVLAPSKEKREQFESHIKAVFTAENPTKELTVMDRLSNAYSVLLKVTEGAAAILFAADHVPKGWKEIDFSLLKNVNVLKLPHHGQIDSIDEALMKDMPLEYVISTASSDRRYNSANRIVYETLCRIHPDIHILFTDEREYLPFFEHAEGAHAIRLMIHSNEIQMEFIKIAL